MEFIHLLLLAPYTGSSATTGTSVTGTAATHGVTLTSLQLYSTPVWPTPDARLVNSLACDLRNERARKIHLWPPLHPVIELPVVCIGLLPVPRSHPTSRAKWVSEGMPGGVMGYGLHCFLYYSTRVESRAGLNWHFYSVDATDFDSFHFVSNPVPNAHDQLPRPANVCVK